MLKIFLFLLFQNRSTIPCNSHFHPIFLLSHFGLFFSVHMHTENHILSQSQCRYVCRLKSWKGPIEPNRWLIYSTPNRESPKPHCATSNIQIIYLNRPQNTIVSQHVSKIMALGHLLFENHFIKIQPVLLIILIKTSKIDYSS